MTGETHGGRSPQRLKTIPSILLLLTLTFTTISAVKFTFTEPGEHHPSILLQVDYVISIKAFENNMVVAAWIGGTHDHPNPEVLGISGQRSVIELNYPTEEIAWGVIFDEKAVNDVSVDRFVKFTPVTIFPPFPDLDYELSFEDKGNTDIHSVFRSFQCDKSVTRVYVPSRPLKGRVTFEVSVTVSNFRAQAFHIKDGQFSPSDHCTADQRLPVTTPSHLLPTTTTPRYIPIPGGGNVPVQTFIGNQTIDNTTSIQCISMQGRVSFDIAYYIYDGRYRTTRKLVRVPIPQSESVKTDGVCQMDAGRQTLNINFFNGWAVEFVFGINVAYSLPTEQGSHQSKLDYSMKSVSLKYNIDDDLKFPQAFKSEGSNFSISFTEHEILPRKRASSGFFVCNTPKRFQMSDDVTLVLSDLKFKAFIDDGDLNFYGIPNTCEEDMKQIGASTLVVVVGCLVITFSLIVFIALLALISAKCRTKRRRRKYTSI